MIQTVLGKIHPEELGVTLMHEHIIWNWNGAEAAKEKSYNIKDIVDTMESSSQRKLKIKKLMRL